MSKKHCGGGNDGVAWPKSQTIKPNEERPKNPTIKPLNGLQPIWTVEWWAGQGVGPQLLRLHTRLGGATLALSGMAMPCVVHLFVVMHVLCPRNCYLETSWRGHAWHELTRSPCLVSLHKLYRITLGKNTPDLLQLCTLYPSSWDLLGHHHIGVPSGWVRPVRHYLAVDLPG